MPRFGSNVGDIEGHGPASADPPIAPSSRAFRRRHDGRVERSGSKPGWVYDASSGYYHDPSTGVYFDQQRGAYHAHGRWLSHAEYTATYSKSVAAPQHVVHPSLSRGGVGESHPVGGSSNLVHAPPGAAAPPVSTGGWGTSMPAYGANAVGASSDVSTASADGMTRRRGASHHTQQPTPSFQPPPPPRSAPPRSASPPSAATCPR